MKIKVDSRLHVSEFGRRITRKDSLRYYYQVVGYDCLVLVFHDDDYVGWQDKVGVALFNFDTVDGRIICDQFPNAPGRWRDNADLIQCTVRRVPRLPDGRTWPLLAFRSHRG